MKQTIHYLFMLLLMLLTGVGGVKAQEILTEGFEKKEAGSNYQSTVTVKSDESDCGIGWEIYYGTVSTSSKITGSNSAALRLYTTSNNYGYLKSTTPVEGLSKVDFKAKAATSNGAKIKINVSYSTDGNSWISLETDKALTSSAAVYSYDIPSGGKFFQIAISSESTKPSSSNAQLTIDDVVFTYSDLGKENVDLSFGEISSQTVGVGKSVKVEATATPSVPISYSSSDETIAIVSTDGTVTGKKPGTTTIKASFAGNDQYNSASDEYELTVIPSELGGDVTEETIIINEPYGNSGNNAIILYDKGTNGQNGPFYYNNSELRLYCGNTLTVSSESKKIATIVFDFVVNGNKNNVIPTGISCTSGSCEDFNKLSTSLTSAVWNAPTNNGVSEVTFTIIGSAGNVGFKSAKVYYVLKSFDVAPASNNESYGTVSFEEGVITATPAEGYRVSLTNPYEVTPAGAATVVQDENDFTVTATADCTVQINFEAIPTHTVTFSVNGTETSKSFAEGSNITFDIPADVLDKKFVGWTTATIDGTTDECPELVTLGTMGNADVKYYAVFANKEGTFENASIKIDANTEGVPSSYGTANKFAEYELEGKKFQIQQMYKNGDKLQWRAAGNSSGTGTLYNVDELQSIQSIVLTYDKSDTNKNFTVNVGNTENPTSGTAITPSTNENVYTFDCSSQNSSYFVLANGSGAGYLTSFTINYVASSVKYSDYCTTVVAPVKPAKPIVFHDSGTYEGSVKVSMTAPEGVDIYYTLSTTRNTEGTKYTAPITISETSILTAWAVQDGATSDVVTREYTIVENAKGPSVTEKYYTISNNNKYVNVAGRRTVTFVGEDATATAAGTVIKVSANEDGQVQVLRSQGVDVPAYAQRAMVYVPKVVKLVAEKLGAEGEGNLLGKDGLDAIMKKFDESFDEHLYLESAGENAYRIYGRTPSMQPVVEFYAENKANVDEKLKGLEAFINSAIDKVLEKTGGRGTSILKPYPEQPAFSLMTVWENMVVKTPGLTKPEDETTTAKFYEEVLSSETNVWNFAYETAMIYWSRLKTNKTFLEKKESLGEFAKYIDKIEYIRPNVKYYLVQNESGLDVFSQDNPLLAGTSEWTLAERTEFKVTVPEDNLLNGKYYTTFYADFAYEVPSGLKAYTVKEIKEGACYSYAEKEEITGVIPAQTAVLLEADAFGEQTLTLKPEDTSAAIENKLKGPDYLIEVGKINSAMVENLFDMALGILGKEGYDHYLKEYEHLMLRTSGTVNNKYFFGLSKDDCKDVEDNVCVLDGTSFNTGWMKSTGALYENKAFLVDGGQTTILLAKPGDVNRDGKVTIADVTALVNIILGKATEADNYDMVAADVNCDEKTTIADVTALVNIILGKN